MMRPTKECGRELPIVDRRAIGASSPTREPTIAGVLLAAGTSSRFGAANKLLAVIDGEPMVRRAAKMLVAAQTDPIIVVVGYEARRVRGALSDMDIDFVDNERYERGQATSVEAAARELENYSVDAAVFALGDMPFVSPESVDALVDAYRTDIGDAIAAAYDGARGNPVLFDMRYFEALADVSGDTGGRDVLFGAENACLLDVDDPGVIRDVNQINDLPDGR